MEEEQKEGLLLHIWLRLDEARNMLSAIEKGLDREAELNTSEVHGIISIIKRELEGLLEEIDKAV